MLQDRLELFASNAQIVRRKFIWHHILTQRMVALIYSQEGRTIEHEKIRDCLNMIKKNTGVFSSFRGNMALCIAALLSLSENPQELLEETLNVYGLLKNVKFRASDFLVIAALEIAKQTTPDNYESVVDRARQFYDGMKAFSFFHTGHDDYIFSAMLGLSDLDVKDGVSRINQIYDRLKDEFWSKNSVQALAQILVLSGADDGIDRILVYRNALREQKIKLDKTYTLSSLGVLSLLPVEIDVVVRDMNDAKRYLRSQKGFSSFSVSTQELLLYTVAVVANEYAQNIKDGVLTATLSTSIANIIIAQQMAMIAAITASRAAAAASHSS